MPKPNQCQVKTIETMNKLTRDLFAVLGPASVVSAATARHLGDPHASASWLLAVLWGGLPMTLGKLLILTSNLRYSNKKCN